MTATVDSSGSAASHWSEERIEIARQASGQVESLLYMLHRESQGTDWSTDAAFESTLVRIKQLNSVMMSMLSNDDLRETKDMRKVVHGHWAGEDA